MISKEEFKNLFIELTEYTIPYGQENKMEKFLPKGYTKDSAGNYYIEIGNSETLFECHLDTSCYESEKVNHIIEGDIIKTDGSTILGGDNKAGMVILLSMIKERKPGTYYFFIGEEKMGIGAKRIFASNPDYFRQFQRSIAFDRRGYGSVVNIQFGRPCCSTEFEEAVVKKLEGNGIPWDNTASRGMGTDNAILMDVIPEVTNISSGTFNEHHNDEYVDIDYTYKLFKAVMKINWEDLPTVRIPMDSNEYYEHEYRMRKSQIDKNGMRKTHESLFIKKFNDFKNKKGEN